MMASSFVKQVLLQLRVLFLSGRDASKKIPVSLDADADIQWWKQRFRKMPNENIKEIGSELLKLKAHFVY